MVGIRPGGSIGFTWWCWCRSVGLRRSSSAELKLNVMFEDLDWEDASASNAPDPVEINARESLRDFFERNHQRVYFSRQLEVQNEDRYFHWITNRAIRDLEAEGVILSERRNLSAGGTIKLLWHRRFRYYKREATKLVDLVNDYSAPNIGAALGLQGE